MSKRETFLGSIAVSALALSDGAAPQWIQLTPVTNGVAKAIDGRSFPIRDAAGIVKASLSRGPIAIDANHATDLAGKAGQPAPAAGWIEEIATHGPANEPGLWGRVAWTPTGERAVKDREYRFISPVLLHAKKDGEVLAILRAALTNDPALVMTGLFHNQETTDVDLTELCTLLGLPATSTVDQVRSALAALKTNNAAMCAREKLLLSAAGLTAEALDDTTTTALCAKIKQPAAAADANISALSAKVEKLTVDLNAALLANQGRDATAEVEAAIAAGKWAPALKDDGIALCTKDPAMFKKLIAGMPVIVSTDRLTPEQVAEGALNATEKSICSALGITEDAFKATKAETAARAK